MRNAAPLTVLLLALVQPAIAATFKWVDEKGVTHYGDTMPPDDSRRGGAQIDQRGQVIKKYDAVLTPEQLKARDAEITKQKELDKQREEQRRRDLALVNAYTGEQEIDLARDRYTQSIDTIIHNAEERIKNNDATIANLHSQLQAFTAQHKDGSPRDPLPLIQELQRIKAQQPALEAAIGALQKEREQVIMRFAQDRQRFLEIKDGNAGTGQALASEVKVSVRTTKSLAITKTSERLITECIDRWRDTHRFGNTAYAVSADLVEDSDRTELVLDGRVRSTQGGFTASRFVCTLTADGKVDSKATDVKKALASLGARY
jgi:hypothetical protein